MATTGRVQVNDLAAPEAIRPYGFQSDTFAAPARAPINDNWAQLERGLAAFGSGVNALHARQKADAEKQHAEDMAAYEERAKADVARFRLSKNSDEMMEAWRSGAVPYQHDPIMARWLNKQWAQDEAEAFGRQLDTDEHLRENIGKEGFDVQGYIREKLAPYSARLYGEEGVLAIFADGVSRHEARVIETDNQIRGANRVMLAESRAMQQLDRAFEQGIEDGLPPSDEFSDAYRAIYKELGPRVKGGAADIRLGRLDELLLDVLKDKAADPSKAEHVLALLDAERFSTDDDTTRLGPLSSVEAHREKVAAIRRAAEKAMADREKSAIQEGAIDEAARRFGAQDGSFAAFGDQRVQSEYNGTVDVSADDVKKEAAIRWRDALREANGGTPDVVKETDYFAANGVVHEEFFATLKNGYYGLGNVLLKPGQAPDANAVEQIKRSAALYKQMSKQAPNYMQQLPDDVRDFYEMIAAAEGPMGLDADQAAMLAMRVAAEGKGENGRGISGEGITKLESATDNFGRVWYKPWFMEGIENGGDLMPTAMRLTRLYMKMGNGEAAARDMAIAKLNETTAVVNGKAIIGMPGIEKDKEGAMTAAIGGMWKQHWTAIKASTGASSADDLYFKPVGRAYLQLVGPGGIPAKSVDGHEIHTTPRQLLRVQVNMKRAEEMRRHRAIATAREREFNLPPAIDSPLSQGLKGAAGAVGSAAKSVGRAVGGAADDYFLDPLEKSYAIGSKPKD